MEKIRQKKKQLTREKLLEAASVEFAQYGYPRAHMDRISTNAGFGKGTIYNYFPSKYDLLLSVTERAMELLTEEIRKHTSHIPDPVERIKHALEVDFEFLVKNEALSKVIIREGFAADPQRQKEFLDALAPVAKLVLELLDEGRKAGKFRKDIDAGLATLVSQGIVGYLLLVRWSLNDMRFSPQQLADLTMKCFVEGILTR